MAGLDNLMRGRRGEEAMVEEMATLDPENEQESGVPQWEGCIVSLCVSDDKHHMSAFPLAVFHLEAYKLVYVTVILPNDSSVVVVRKSYVSILEQDLNMRCFPYNIEPSREDVELLCLVEAQHRKVDALARMLDKGLWICIDRVLHLFATWLRAAVAQSKTDSLAFPEQTGIENDRKLGRIGMHGYNFDLYTLVSVSNLGQYAQNLDKLGGLDDILSIVELEDESWELPVRKSYLPRLKNMLHKMVPECITQAVSDTTEPTAKELEDFGYERARILRTMSFRNRAECMVSESWPKAAAFYADLRMGLEKEMTSLEYGHIREREAGRGGSG
ncbi:hypothetical protein DL95DRAFT_517915 [Leptodontidium sp. 2 PMI_412]|nr:hypothetical protein DL95DRAFT_517915 [Leptodontidium sp. 2 PMI_412]